MIFAGIQGRIPVLSTPGLLGGGSRSKGQQEHTDNDRRHRRHMCDRQRADDAIVHSNELDKKAHRTGGDEIYAKNEAV